MFSMLGENQYRSYLKHTSFRLASNRLNNSRKNWLGYSKKANKQTNFCVLFCSLAIKGKDSGAALIIFFDFKLREYISDFHQCHIDYFVLLSYKI